MLLLCCTYLRRELPSPPLQGSLGRLSSGDSLLQKPHRLLDVSLDSEQLRKAGRQAGKKRCLQRATRFSTTSLSHFRPRFFQQNPRNGRYFLSRVVIVHGVSHGFVGFVLPAVSSHIVTAEKSRTSSFAVSGVFAIPSTTCRSAYTGRDGFLLPFWLTSASLFATKAACSRRD